MNAQKKQILTDTAPIKINNVPGTTTFHFYYNDDEDKVKHGVETMKVEASNREASAKCDITINWADGKKEGKIIASQSIKYKGSSVVIKLEGEYKNDLMAGMWKITHQEGGTTSISSFSIKDRRISAIKDGVIGIDISVDEKGRVTGKYSNIIFKNNICTNNMIDKTGKPSTPSPKAKSMIDELAKRDVSPKELVANGFYLQSDVFKSKAIPETLDLFDLQLDDDLTTSYRFYCVCQIPDDRWLSWDDCKSILDSKRSNLDECLKVGNDMIDDYGYQGRYIKQATAQSIEDYMKDILSFRKNEFVSTINGKSDLKDLVLYVKQQEAVFELFSEEEQQEIGKVFNDKFTQLHDKKIAEIKKKIVEESDFTTLDRYYETIKPDMSFFKEDEVSDINQIYKNRKIELQAPASVKITGEINKKTNSQDLTKYYEEQESTINQLPDASAIKSAYKQKLDELVVKEEKEKKKAERKKKAGNFFKSIIN